MTGVTEPAIRQQQHLRLHNTLWWIAVFLLFAVGFRGIPVVLDGLNVQGAGRLIALLVFEVIFGACCYLLFRGALWLRILLACTVLYAFGFALDWVRPVRGHAYVQTLGMTVAAVFVISGMGLGRLLERLRRRAAGR